MRSLPSLLPRLVPVALRSGIPSGPRAMPLLLVPVLLMLLMPLVPPVGAVPGFGRAAGSADFFDVPRLLPVAVTRPVDTRRVAPARPVTPRFGALRCLFDAFLALDDFELPFFYADFFFFLGLSSALALLLHQEVESIRINS